MAIVSLQSARNQAQRTQAQPRQIILINIPTRMHYTSWERVISEYLEKGTKTSDMSMKVTIENSYNEHAIALTETVCLQSVRNRDQRTQVQPR